MFCFGRHGLPLLVAYGFSVASTTANAGQHLAFPFGDTANDVYLTLESADVSQAFTLPEPMCFLQHSQEFAVKEWYFGSPGFMTFDSPYFNDFDGDRWLDLSQGAAGKFVKGPALVAPFWSDIDPSMASANDNILWARTSTSAADLALASNIVNGCSGGTFTPTAVLVATWIKVEPYNENGRSPLRNTFQGAIAYNENETFLIFSYDELEWFRSGCFTVFDSEIGYRDHLGNGDLLKVVGSNANLNEVLSGSNCASPTPGRYVYKVDCLNPESQLDQTNLVFPFGKEANDSPMLDFAPNFGSSVTLSQPMCLLETTVDELSTSPYGYLSFGENIFDFPGGNFAFQSDSTSGPFDPDFTNGQAVVAPFWDYSWPFFPYFERNQSWLRISTAGSDKRIAKGIVRQNGGSIQFNPHTVVVASWVNVESQADYYDTSGVSSGFNTFQVALAYNEEETWVIFDYDRLDWLGFNMQTIRGEEDSTAQIGFLDGLGNGDFVNEITRPIELKRLLAGSTSRRRRRSTMGTYAYQLCEGSPSGFGAGVWQFLNGGFFGTR